MISSRLAQSILDVLVRNRGASSAFVLDERGAIVAFSGLAPQTEIIWMPSPERLAKGPASTISASGERLAFAAIDEGYVVGAVFSSELSAAAAEDALRSVTARH